MAATSISALTLVITGATCDSGVVSASGDTCTISAPTGDALDLNSLVIRVANEATGGGAIISVEAGGSTYSGIGVGDYDITLATAGTVYIGGKGLESARFLDASDQTLILTFKSPTGSGSTCYCTIEAVQAPFQITG